MSSRQRKRPGGAVDSRPARKRSRLLPSSAGGTWQTEPIDPEQSGTSAFGPEVIDPTGESSDSEVIIISDDESDVESEQSQQQPPLFRASVNSAEPLARDDEDDRSDVDIYCLTEFDPPSWSDEESQDRLRNQQQPQVSSAAENAAEPLASDDEEEPRHIDSRQPGGSTSRPSRENEDSEESEQSQQQPPLFRASVNSAEPLARDDEDDRSDVDIYWLTEFDPPSWSDEESQDRLRNQQQPQVSSAAENAAEPLASDDEEEPRHIDSRQPGGSTSRPSRENEDSEESEQSQQQPPLFRASVNSAEPLARDDEDDRSDVDIYWLTEFDPPSWSDEESQDRLRNQQQPQVSSAAENAAEPLASDDEEEPRHIDSRQPGGSTSRPSRENEDSELPEVHEQERRNVTLNNQEQVDGSGSGTGANDAAVADSAPAEQRPEEENTERSDAQQGVVIRCPICMDVYSEIMESERQLVATMCGHIFCRECLVTALENDDRCPTCREELASDIYIPIYL